MTSELTMGHNAMLAGVVNNITGNSNASHLRQSTAQLVGALYAATVGGSSPHLTMSIPAMLAAIRNNVSDDADVTSKNASIAALLAQINNAWSDDPDLSARTSSVGKLLAGMLSATPVEGGGGDPGEFTWPLAPDTTPARSVASPLDSVYRVGGEAGTDLTFGQVFERGDYYTDAGLDLAPSVGALTVADDVGAGGLLLCGYGPRRMRAKDAGGAFVADMVADDTTLIFEFEDVLGAFGSRTLLALTHDETDTYTIGVVMYVNAGVPQVSFFDYDAFSADVINPTWNEGGVNRIGLTFSGGMASISVNGGDAVTGALDLGAELPITGFQLGYLMDFDVALHSIAVHDAMSDADLKTATTVASPTSELGRTDSNLYGMHYYEVFDATIPADFKNTGDNIEDMFCKGSDPYLWDVTDPTNVNLTPLPGVLCVPGSGLPIPSDLSLLPAMDIEIFLNLARNTPLCLGVEWEETDGNVTRKGGLATMLLTDGNNQNGFAQLYFETGHVKMRLRMDHSAVTDCDTVLTGGVATASAIGRAVMFFDPASGDFGLSVNGAAVVSSNVALTAPNLSWSLGVGKAIGFLSEPTTLPGDAKGAQTASAGLGGYLREVVSFKDKVLADIPGLSALA